MPKSAKITPQGLCAVVQQHILAWPQGQIRVLDDCTARRTWGTVLRVGGLHVLAWVSAEDHGQVMEQLMVFDFRQPAAQAFRGYEKGPASKAGVIRTISLRSVSRGTLRDENVRDCLLEAVRDIGAWSEDMKFRQDWSETEEAAVSVMLFCGPWEPELVRMIPDQIQQRRTSPEGHPF